MNTRGYTFYLRLGDQELVECVFISDAASPSDVQAAYEVWRKQRLIYGWWNEENNAEAFEKVRKIVVAREDLANEQS